MKSKALWIATGVFVLISLGFIAAGWNGTFGVTAGFPLSSTEVKFCGSATGKLAFFGILSMIVALVLLLLAAIRSIFVRP